ncbi:hypothetical protein LK540_17190 [Massilia sp. IC2-278]|uniref:hypothetical protein n=1 Tax=Massilia sp. IC2-278 TaxID=2887200 RepID=UPI001E6331F5|nr:hypothetical protein [Massilia sp. IC2-278]MCC2962164.1 hypothetical protein [Massilia sp. IC2-278]
MKEVTGQLKMLGSGSVTRGNVGSSFVKYNTIQIGNTILQKIVTAQSLDDFIQKGLGHEVTLFLNKNMLVAVKLQDGQVYYWKRSVGLFLMSVLVSLLILGFAIVVGGAAGNFIIPVVIALAVIFFTMAPFILQTVSYQPKLAALGGIPLRG